MRRAVNYLAFPVLLMSSTLILVGRMLSFSWMTSKPLTLIGAATDIFLRDTRGFYGFKFLEICFLPSPLNIFLPFLLNISSETELREGQSNPSILEKF
jgi:hypothetical protein